MKQYYMNMLRNWVIFFSTVIILISISNIYTPLQLAWPACITYSSSSHTITISCATATRLTDINNVLNNANILKKESTGVWLLAANLVVAKGGSVLIDSTDTTWLKIQSNGNAAYGLQNYGTLSISSVKITSWNTVSDTYGSPGTDGKTPRGYIIAKGGATGKLNIVKCHCAYLGYTGSGNHGIDYYGSDGSVIQDSELDHNYRAFYSSGVGGIRLDRNVVHDNIEYGIDPHSGTHDMYITYNKIYNNNHGVICSVACFNMHIENNEIYNNQRDGVFLDAGSHHSTIASNNIHDVPDGIQLPSLSYSEIKGNTIYNAKVGIQIYQQVGSTFDRDGRCVPYGCVSVNNNIHDNKIKASSIGIEIKDSSSGNTITSNTIDGLNGDRGIVVDGSKTNGNVFNDNHISNAKYSIRVTGGNVNSKFVNNHPDTLAAGGEYTLTSSSALKMESTQFSADVIRELDSSSIPISISKSGTISVVDGSTTKSYNTNTQPYAKTLTNNGKITVTTVATSTASSTSSTKISSTDTNSRNTTLTDKSDATNPKPSYVGKGSEFSGVSSNKSEVNGRITGGNLGQSDDKVSKTQNAANNLDAEHQARLAEQKAQDKLTGNTDNNTKLSGLTEKPLRNLVTSNGHKIDAAQNKESPSHDDQKTLNKIHVSKKLNPRGADQKLSQNNQKNTDDNSKMSNEISSPKDMLHKTLLTLRSSGNGRNIITGTLWDKTTSKPLEGMKIYFTITDSSIKVRDQITDAAGAFKSMLTLPETPATYKIQAHFAKVYPYLAADSPFVTVEVRSNEAILNQAQHNR